MRISGSVRRMGGLQRRMGAGAAMLAASVGLAPGQGKSFDQTPVTESALDVYTAERDPAFAWQHAATESADGVTTHLLRLTSQTWRGEGEVSHPVWTHWLRIAVPDEVKANTPLLLIGGGKRREEAPKASAGLLTMLAKQAGTAVVFIDNVPNQPLVLNGDGVERFEDDLIAETWMTARKTGDVNWVVQHAMAKSAVAAMDATEAFFASERGGGTKVDGFVITGGSKRGWTTWLAACVDERVRGIIPMVIDTLNLPATVRHHWSAYGFWAPAIHDYTDRGLFEWMGEPGFRTLREQVDAYVYRPRLTMPKFLLNAAGDQYFLPDTSRFYANDLPGETRLRYVPNADHSIDDDDPSAILSAVAFHQAVSRGATLPRLEWRVVSAGATPGTAGSAAGDAGSPFRLRVRASVQPATVKVWRADNASARDFRLATIGKAWTATEAEPKPVTAGETPPVYDFEVSMPAAGYRACFAEYSFTVPGVPLPLVFTTEVFVLPDVLPFAELAVGQAKREEAPQKTE